MENGETTSEIHCKGNGQKNGHAKEDSKRPKITARQELLKIRLPRSQDHQQNHGRQKAAGAKPKPSQEKVLYIRHVEAVLLIEEILLLPVHPGDNGQFFLFPDKIGHHVIGHFHHIPHLHTKGSGHLIFLIFRLIESILGIPVDRQLETGDQKGQDQKKHGQRPQGFLCFRHLAAPF